MEQSQFLTSKNPWVSLCISHPSCCFFFHVFADGFVFCTRPAAPSFTFCWRICFFATVLLLILSRYCWWLSFSHPSCCSFSHAFADGSVFCTRPATSFTFLLTGSVCTCFSQVFSNLSVLLMFFTYLTVLLTFFTNLSVLLTFFTNPEMKENLTNFSR